MYSEFASVYDELMEEVDYAAWAEYYGKLLEDAGLRDGDRVTECACGTGSLTVELAGRYQICGVDISQEMLSIAADKLRIRGRQVPLVRQDMRQLTLHRPQDAILCTCDGLNYLLDERAASEFFSAAYRALRPGGLLCFDVSSYYKLSKILGDNTLVKTQGRVHYIWENQWHADKRLLDLRLQLYVHEKAGCWRHVEEIQCQRAWTEQELSELLIQAGFEQPHILGDRTLSAPHFKEERLHFQTHKPKDKTV